MSAKYRDTWMKSYDIRTEGDRTRSVKVARPDLLVSEKRKTVFRTTNEARLVTIFIQIRKISSKKISIFQSFSSAPIFYAKKREIYAFCDTRCVSF